MYLMLFDDNGPIENQQLADAVGRYLGLGPSDDSIGLGVFQVEARVLDQRGQAAAEDLQAIQIIGQ